jgi:hypothetical protein
VSARRHRYPNACSPAFREAEIRQESRHREPWRS